MEKHKIVLVDRTEVEREGEVLEYAILSHRWQREEVTYRDLAGRWSAKYGAAKLRSSIQLAKKHGYNYLWIDTCCIDKDSSAELSEAINSMYRWYKDADICYTYLCDVDAVENLAGSAWFTRGWTLQELIAPRSLHFYDTTWKYIGTRRQLADTLNRITGIPTSVLIYESDLEAFSIAQRMSWASNRRTQRPEDIAYSLMGLFSINMPLLYGEGDKAFTRLQEEIIKTSDDYTIFAWQSAEKSQYSSFDGLFAGSPSYFGSSGDIIPYYDWRNRAPMTITGSGLSLDLGLLEQDGQLYATLPCTREGSVGFASILLTRPGPPRFMRMRHDLLPWTYAEGKPCQMLFRRDGSLPWSAKRQDNVHEILIDTNHDIRGLAAVVNLHPSRSSNVDLRPSRVTRGPVGRRSLAFICTPRWDCGREAYMLFKHEATSIHFIILLGTGQDGDIAYQLLEYAPNRGDELRHDARLDKVMSATIEEMRSCFGWWDEAARVRWFPTSLGTKHEVRASMDDIGLEVTITRDLELSTAMISAVLKTEVIVTSS